MWPWGHAAVGYLLLSLWWRSEYDVPPVGRAVLAAALGTQFPDLIDKPLAWTLSVLPNGRSLGHSALTAALVCTVLWLVYRDSDHRRLVGAFALGYWSHLLSDAIDAVVAWDPELLTYLAYPLVRPVSLDASKSFVQHFASLEPTAKLGFELLLVALALVAWRRDGYPGLRLVGRRAGLVGPEPDPQDQPSQD